MTTDQITLVGIGVTFLIGLLNFVYSIGNNRKTRFINTVTSSRVKWIDDLRKNVSDYISLLPLTETNYLELFENKKEFIESFTKLNMIIELMLNKEDEFDRTLIKSLRDVNEKVSEIIKCSDLLNFSKIKEYEELGIESKHSIKVGLINQLSSQTQNIFKLAIIEKMRKSNDLVDMSGKDVIIKTEYEVWGIKKDAYIKCISEISREIDVELKKLTENSQVLLKTEWDRVKVESLVGIYDMKSQDWNLIVGFYKLNKIYKLILIGLIIIVIILLMVVK